MTVLNDGKWIAVFYYPIISNPFFMSNRSIVMAAKENQISIPFTVKEAEQTYELVRAINNQAVTSSLRVSEYFGKAHKGVLRAIKSLECSESFNRRNFAPVEYTDKKGEKRPMYYMTRDGFTLLAMGFTGKVAAQFKENYINAFNQMEETIRNNECTKYAEKTIEAEIEKFNKNMRSISLRLRKEKGMEYGAYGEIQTGVFPCEGLPLREKMKNVFIQIGNAYAEAYTLAGDYLKLEEENKELRKMLAEFEGEMARRFRIYPKQ